MPRSNSELSPITIIIIDKNTQKCNTLEIYGLFDTPEYFYYTKENGKFSKKFLKSEYDLEVYYEVKEG